MSAATDRLRQLAAQATPGPWRVREEVGSGLYDVTFREAVDSASISYAAMSVEETDARLIALAPELATLLADMADALVDCHHDFDPRVGEGCSICTPLLVRVGRLTGDTAA